MQDFLEVPPRFELGVEVLQTFALPLGYGTVFSLPKHYNKEIRKCQAFLQKFIKNLFFEKTFIFTI